MYRVIALQSVSYTSPHLSCEYIGCIFLVIWGFFFSRTNSTLLGCNWSNEDPSEHFPKIWIWTKKEGKYVPEIWVLDAGDFLGGRKRLGRLNRGTKGGENVFFQNPVRTRLRNTFFRSLMLLTKCKPFPTFNIICCIENDVELFVKHGIYIENIVFGWRGAPLNSGV